MYIDYEDFDEFSAVTMGSDYKFYSPGWVARVFGVSRQAVAQWITNDIVTAYRLNDKEGRYVLISEEEYSKIEEYRKGR